MIAGSSGKRIILAGHRGDRKHAPENTLAGYRAAVALGVNAMEVDIHMSRDGIVFMMHDHKLDRTTNGSGFTHEKDWKDIRCLDAGSWFSDEFKGEQVPSLEETLQYFASVPDLMINWELKDYPENVGTAFSLRCADQLLDGIARYKLTDRSMLNSFSSEVLEYVAQKSGGLMPIHGQGVAASNKMHGTVSRNIREYWDWACLYPINATIAEKEVFDACKDLGIIPCVCIPDTMENYRYALENGCRMFTSNDPEEGLRLLKELGCMV